MSRRRVVRIIDWFALALCPWTCLDAIIYPPGTVTLRDSSGQDGRGGKTLQVARYGLRVTSSAFFVIPRPQEGCLS
jgi:hypothetical protein